MRLFSNKQSGLSLIELIVAMVIVGIIGLSLNQYLIGSVKAYIATKNNISALTKIHSIDKRLNLEIREVNFNSINNAFNTTTLLFTNIDTVTLVKFEYDAVNNLLKMDYADPALTILSDNITAFTFTYYKNDGTTPVLIGVDPSSDIAFVTYNYDITENGVSYTSIGRVMLRDRR